MKRAIIAFVASFASTFVPVDLPSFSAAANLPPPNRNVCPPPWKPVTVWFRSEFRYGDPFILTPSDGVTTTYSDPTGDDLGVYVVATMNPPIVQRCPVLNHQLKQIGKNVDVQIDMEQFYICLPPVLDEHLTLTSVGAAIGFTQAACDPFVFEDQGAGSSWHHR